MGDLCIDDDTTDILSTVGHALNESYTIERHCYQRKHEVHCDSVSSTNFLVDYFGLYLLVDDIFTRLLTLTTDISHQLICFVEDLLSQDIDEYLNNLGSSSPGLCSRSSSHNTEGCSPHSTYCFEDSSASIHDRRALDDGEDSHVNVGYEVRKGSCSHGGVSFFIQGLMLPLCCFQLAWRFTSASWRCTLYYVRGMQVHVRGITSRVYKTLHGSSDDIGWLQCTPGMAPVDNGTPRFIELLTKIRNGEHRLPDSFVYLLIPGLFSNHGPLYFVGIKRFFSKMGLACHIAKIHSEASVEHNAWELKQYIEELYWGSGKRVMLLGHSKGGVDAAAALSIYWCHLKDKVAGLALVQSPYGGTPLASDILREGQIADKETRRIMELLICKLIKGDIRALEDLTYDKRREFLMKHKLPKQIPVISFYSEASITLSVLATMTRIAQAELPWLPLPKFGSEEPDDVVQAGCKVPVVIPISAVMAVCALHLQLRYGEKSDGLVTCRDAEVPGSVVVRPDSKLDHAWMVYSSRKKDPSEPESGEMCEALLTMLVELDKNKQESNVCESSCTPSS